ncbi:MAG: asparaginase [Oscillospiraceae bacterium]|nr:asparaginase [Oscillospiraceae bacterium]
MNRKRNILLLATGGTIASMISEHGLKPGLDAEQLLSFIPEIREECQVDSIQVCNIDSTNMKPEIWRQIVCAVEAKYLYYDGFVICHGTDTMAYTSAALSYMILNSNKPVVITGSQKPISEDSTDARQNLIDSIRYAADPDSRGVVLVFNGSVIAGTRAKKTYAHSYNAFSSVNFPPIATIQERKIIRFIPQQPFTQPVHFVHDLNDSVVVLKLIPGTKPELVEYLFQNYDCLVIESFGVGGIPQNLLDVFYTQMEQWISRGKIVVMATQVTNEGSNMEVYEVGQKVKEDFHLMEAYDMTLEATITKLMVLMGTCGGSYTAICDGFYKTVNYDILSR